MADTIDLSDLGGKPVDLSDLGGTPVDQQQDQNIKLPGILQGLVNSKYAQGIQSGIQDLGETVEAGGAAAGESATAHLGGKTLAAIEALGSAGKEALQTGKIPNLVGSIDQNQQEPLTLKYQRYKQALSDKEAQLAQNNPIATLGGDILGVAATAPLIPELGGEQVITRLGEAAPALDTFLAGKGASGLSRIAGKATSSAIQGAPAGALIGAASSNADNPEDFAKDVGTGMLMGSGTGLALGGAAAVGSEAMNAASNLSNKYDFLRKIKASYNMGVSGQGLGSSVSKSNVAAQLQSMPNEVSSSIRAADKYNGELVGASLDPNINPNANTTINIDPDLQQNTDDLYKTLVIDNPALLQTLDPTSRQLLSKLNNIGSGDLTPLEAKGLQDTLYDLNSKMAGMSSDISNIIRQKSQAVAQALDGALKDQIPEYADAAQKFADFRSNIAEPLLQPELPADKRTKLLGDLKNKDTALYQGASNVFGHAMNLGESALPYRQGLNEVIGNLDDLEQSNPEAMKILGGSAQDVGQRWQDMADKMSMLKKSQMGEGMDRSIKSTMLGTGEALGIRAANIAGKMQSAVGQTGPVKVASRLFNANDGQLMQLAQTLKSKPAIGWYGDALEKALNDKNEFARNAVLFKLMQIPEYRDMLSQPGDNPKSSGPGPTLNSNP